MTSEHYPRVIREWCEATGMEVWDERHDMHVEINDTLVGLIPGGDDEPDSLHIYLDLGHHELPDLYASLLEANVAIDADDQGCFGLHPLTQSVVYRTKRRLQADTDGSQLPTALDALIRSTRSRLSSALTY
jgi:hypothetical protein